MPSTGLSGFCGLTSHQTSSSPRRARACRLISRWPWWAGLNDPPSSPMRRPGRRGGGSSPPGLLIGRSPPGELMLRRAQHEDVPFPASPDQTSFILSLSKDEAAASRPDLAVPADDVFVAGELLGADRAAGVQLAGGDADLGAHAELAAIGELGRGVVQHDGGIDLGEEALRRGAVLRHDRLGVARAVPADMGERAVDAVDQPDTQD